MCFLQGAKGDRVSFVALHMEQHTIKKYTHTVELYCYMLSPGIPLKADDRVNVCC